MKKIAVVEDELYMQEELYVMLHKAGYYPIILDNFQNATKTLIAHCPDLVVLDLNLPGISGFQICRDLKQKTTIPVLVLTSKDQMQDELHALELGADEFLTKPCHSERLLARISNILKRFEGRNNLLEGADFLLDRNTYTIFIHNTSTILPKNQGKILEALLCARDQIVTANELSMTLWGTNEFIDENTLQVNMTRLKKTMTDLGTIQKIETIRGQGYRLKRDRQ